MDRYILCMAPEFLLKFLTSHAYKNTNTLIKLHSVLNVVMCISLYFKLQEFPITI